VLDAAGRPVRVDGRGEVSAPPATVATGGQRAEVVAWAGPWPYDERWWDPGRHRRRARLQVATAGGAAHLLAIEGGRWWVEATYDWPAADLRPAGGAPGPGSEAELGVGPLGDRRQHPAGGGQVVGGDVAVEAAGDLADAGPDGGDPGGAGLGERGDRAVAAVLGLRQGDEPGGRQDPHGDGGGRLARRRQQPAGELGLGQRAAVLVEGVHHQPAAEGDAVAGQQHVEDPAGGGGHRADVLAGEGRGGGGHGVSPFPWGLSGERGGQQGLQRLDELAGGGGGAAAERGEAVVVQGAHGGGGRPGGLGAGAGDRELHRPAVGGVGGALDQAVALEGADQLGDVEGFEAGVVGELALGGAAAGAAHAVERGEHRVLGVGQPVGGDGPVDGGPPPGGEAPDEVAGGGGLGQRGHGQTLYMATMS